MLDSNSQIAQNERSLKKKYSVLGDRCPTCKMMVKINHKTIFCSGCGWEKIKN